MKIICVFLYLLCINLVNGQDPQVISLLRNTIVVEGDSIIVVSSLGSINGVTEEDSIIVSTEAIPFLFISEPTSTKNLPLIEGLEVFPNPAVNTANLRRTTIEEDLYVRLSGIEGTVLYEGKWNSGVLNFALPLSNLPRGIYFIRVTDEKELKGSVFNVVKQ